jgi:hypothetical protein
LLALGVIGFAFYYMPFYWTLFLFIILGFLTIQGKLTQQQQDAEF